MSGAIIDLAGGDHQRAFDALVAHREKINADGESEEDEERRR